MDGYRARWKIELFFLLLKEGYRIEARPPGQVTRIENALALYLAVTWQLLRLMRLRRTSPQWEASWRFEPDKWRATHRLNKKPVPKQMPTFNTVIGLITRLAGFPGRNADGEPGTKTQDGYCAEGRRRKTGTGKQSENPRECE